MLVWRRNYSLAVPRRGSEITVSAKAIDMTGAA
jgi:hypothetical protein